MPYIHDVLYMRHFITLPKYNYQSTISTKRSFLFSAYHCFYDHYSFDGHTIHASVCM